MNAPAVNVHALIRQIIAETDLTDRHEIATKVAGQIPDDQIWSVLVASIEDMVRVAFHRVPAPPSGARHADDAGPSSQGGRELHPAHSARFGLAADVRRVSGDWVAELRKRYHVGRSRYQLYGLCSADDVRWIWSERQRHAEATSAEAKRHYRVWEAMLTHKASTVQDLPADVLASLLKPASSW